MNSNNHMKVASFLVKVWSGLKPQLGDNKNAARYVLCLLGTILEDLASGEGRFADLDDAAKSQMAKQAIAEAEDMLLGLTGISVGPHIAKALTEDTKEIPLQRRAA